MAYTGTIKMILMMYLFGDTHKKCASLRGHTPHQHSRCWSALCCSASCKDTATELT